MSSILKALRKIEEGKRVDKHAAPDLRSDQGFTPVVSKPFIPLLTGVVLGAAIVGLFFFWSTRETASFKENQSGQLLMKERSAGEVEEATATAVNNKSAAVSTATADSLRMTALVGLGLKDNSESSRVSVVTLSPQPVTAAGKHDSTTPKPVIDPATDKKQPPEAAAAKPKLEPQETVVISPVPILSFELPEGVLLQVSEIFFQEDSANSMAVVNDLPVMVGTLIDSAVVAEIRPDSVLFEIGGTNHVVYQSNP